MIPFKKRARFLCSDDFKKVSQSGNLDANYDDRLNSSTSNLVDDREENKTETFLIEKISSFATYDKDVVAAASLSLLAMRQSVGKWAFAVSAVKEGYTEKSTGDKNPVKDALSTRIHDGEPHGNVDCKEGASGVGGDGKQEDETKEVRELEGGCNRSTGSEESNAAVDDGEQVPKALDDSSIHSSADTSIKCINDENSEDQDQKGKRDETGGVVSSEPSVQQANRTFRLFGVNIPYEKEPE
ncbi:hypothetical protein L1987_17371 [Smallanthus sonchifolius]|uniref:Uncharacterized protein n=1 Tax=Smallanthus sonchifolius TaxID=185202 RepID=A0ACB9IXL6_9ASTR|nr:hypothetical protein L1987_17371 [Smallanthus sonchifolius]